MDAFERAAAEIKENSRAFRLVDRLTCECSTPFSTVCAVYAGLDGRLWLWVAGGRGPAQTDATGDQGLQPEQYLPRAVALPEAAPTSPHMEVAACPRCRSGWLLRPQVGGVNVEARLGAPTWAEVVD